MPLPAILTKAVPAGIGQELTLSQAYRTLSLLPVGLEVVFSIFDDVPASAFGVDQVVEVVSIEVGEKIEHERPTR